MYTFVIRLQSFLYFVCLLTAPITRDTSNSYLLETSYRARLSPSGAARFFKHEASCFSKSYSSLRIVDSLDRRLFMRAHAGSYVTILAPDFGERFFEVGECDLRSGGALKQTVES